MSVMTVRDLMSKRPVTLSEHDPLETADELMKSGHFRHLPVVEGERLLGLLTHRDLTRVGAHANSPAPMNRWTEAGWVMTREVRTIEPSRPLLEAAELMLDEKFGCLPVVEDGRLVGILTEADFVAYVLRLLQDPGA
ncbi:MAG: CBS domain-containing protein [Myxococcales bacterium]|nr:CBS domain-containing protein [Myxococcales bacterium]